MEVKHFKDINLISKVLYVISIIILVYTLLTIYNSHVYISSLVASNRIVVSESILMVITYYINSSLPYAFYSIATFSMGYIINELNVKREVEKDIKTDLEDFNKLNEDDNELEELIEYLKEEGAPLTDTPSQNLLYIQLLVILYHLTPFP